MICDAEAPKRSPQFPLSVRNAADAAKVSMNLVERRCQSIAQECKSPNALNEYKAKSTVKLQGEMQPKSLERLTARSSPGSDESG